MYRTVLTSALLLWPAAGFANDALDRFQAAVEAMDQSEMELIVALAPSLADVIPDVTWDAELRTAGQCVMVTLALQNGVMFVGQYLDALEKFASTDFTDIRELQTALPDDLTDSKTMQLWSICGLNDARAARSETSGLRDAINDRDIVAQLFQVTQ